jgi:IS5 family transposase
VAGPAEHAGEPGGRRFASPRIARDRPSRAAGGDGAALRAAQATAAWEAVNRAVLASAKQDKLESGATVRIDSTVTAALMHEPSDSAPLWDACAS